MTKIIITLNILVYTISCYAQKPTFYKGLKFDRLIYFCEKQWIAKNEPDKHGYIPFGYVYLDKDEGIVFQKKGSFKIDRKNRFILNKKDSVKVFERQVIRMNKGFPPSGIMPNLVSIISPAYFDVLKITTAPEWVKPYYNYTDTVEHNYRWGVIYCDELCTGWGIKFLEEAYKTSPHYKGVKMVMDEHDFYFSHQGIELKLASAYNSLGQHDKAETILRAAILNDSQNISFYMELGLTYDGKKEWQKAIDSYKLGMALIKGEKTMQKTWFAGCISNMYGELNNEQEKAAWRAKADAYNPYPGLVN